MYSTRCKMNHFCFWYCFWPAFLAWQKSNLIWAVWKKSVFMTVNVAYIHKWKERFLNPSMNPTKGIIYWIHICKTSIFFHCYLPTILDILLSVKAHLSSNGVLFSEATFFFFEMLHVAVGPGCFLRGSPLKKILFKEHLYILQQPNTWNGGNRIPVNLSEDRTFVFFFLMVSHETVSFNPAGVGAEDGTPMDVSLMCTRMT